MFLFWLGIGWRWLVPGREDGPCLFVCLLLLICSDNFLRQAALRWLVPGREDGTPMSLRFNMHVKIESDCLISDCKKQDQDSTIGWRWLVPGREDGTPVSPAAPTTPQLYCNARSKSKQKTIFQANKRTSFEKSRFSIVLQTFLKEHT